MDVWFVHLSLDSAALQQWTEVHHIANALLCLVLLSGAPAKAGRIC